MNPERWQRIEELFRTVIDRPEVERDIFLTYVCKGDEDLRREVLSLLARDTAEDFILNPIGGVALSLTAEPKDDLTGERIGPYLITRLIGCGGMGTVYEADRDDEQFRQQAAIKIIKRGMDTDFVRDRFLRERQILASLDHPHIARLFDGGTTPCGLPYFVMEFVSGDPITAYCRDHRLSVNDKLRLFRKVCSAVQHAHQKLIVHRDLKPSNILITEDGEPKLLDFGIAKLLSSDVGEARTQTETAMRLMTPEYASPEQARGQAVTTTTDVYSLGIVLYELLTERRPHEFKTYSPAEIERAICDTEIEEPSKVVSRMTGAPIRLSRQLAGDLDNIVLMAMRKEPEQRYQSVEQFSEDIRRHLDGLPVVARKDRFVYRAGKFIRRYQAGMIILALLSILTVAMTVQTARIARERGRANQEAATAQAVTQSLVEMFEVADPRKAGGNVIADRELLDEEADKVVRELEQQPAVQAKLMDKIGQAYQSMGMYDRAQPLLEKALKIRCQTLGNEHPDVATSLDHLAEVARQKGNYAGSESLFREALAMRRKLLGTEHQEVAESLNNLGSLLSDMGKLSEAEPMLREALAMHRKLHGRENTDVAVSLNNLGRLMIEMGRLSEAESLCRQALAMQRILYGADHPQVARSLNNLATVLQTRGDYNGAETLFREGLAMRLKQLGPEHPEVGTNLHDLAVLLFLKGEDDESEKIHREAIDTYRKSLKPDHWMIHRSQSNLGACLTKLKRYREAEEQLLAGYAGLTSALGAQHTETQKAVSHLIELYQSFDKLGKAGPYRALPHANTPPPKK
jgi:serine/threonine-protein kinase